MSSDVLQEKRLERGAVDLLGGVEGSARPDRLEDSGIEVEELRVRDHPPFGTLAEDRNPDGDQQIFEDAEIIFDHFCRYRALASHRRHVENARLREARGLEKSAEGADVPSKSFLLHFFPQIGRRIALQVVLRTLAGAGERQTPEA